ncbi:MAG: hypothetical protein DRN81_02050 [Thermoproteota archaeon]|nr:MAG: hypothetical protein DRN81_02050 [Candidatus Korarchaeota archaeon]
MFILGMIFFIPLLPLVSAQTEQSILFEDDFSGNLSQWNVTEGTYTIDSGVAKSATDGTTSVMFSNETFTADEFTLTFRANANVGSLNDFVFLEINDSYNLRVQMNLGSGFGGLSVKFLEKVDGSSNTIFTDQNYSYLADGEWYSVKLYVNSGSYSFKIWNESDSEPVDWMYEGSLDPDLDLTDGYRIKLYTANLAVTEYGQYDDILLTVTSPPTQPTPPINNIPNGLNVVASIAIVAGFLLFLIFLYMESGLNTQIIIYGTIGAVIIVSLLGYLLTGS